MNIFQFIVVIILTLNLGNIFRIESQLLIPIISAKQSQTQIKLQTMGINTEQDTIQAIDFASKQYGISQEFIIALICSESNFNKEAISCKGYNGLMQIKPMVLPDANILIGTSIFKEKMKIADNDIVKALCLYKGYPIGSKRGIQQANKVLILFDQLRRMEI